MNNDYTRMLVLYSFFLWVVAMLFFSFGGQRLENAINSVPKCECNCSCEEKKEEPSAYKKILERMDKMDERLINLN